MTPPPVPPEKVQPDAVEDARPPVSPDVSDRDLLTRVAHGEEAAMLALVRRFEGEIYRVSLRITGRREDAEEAVQDAFLQVFRKAATFEGRAAVRTWIYSIALNAARMRRRAQARHSEREVVTVEDYFRDDGQFREEAISYALPDRRVLAAETRSAILRAIDALPELDRTIVVLADQEEMSAREIGEALDLTEPAVKSRLHRARVFLRTLLAEFVRTTDAPPVLPAAEDGHPEVSR